MSFIEPVSAKGQFVPDYGNTLKWNRGRRDVIREDISRDTVKVDVPEGEMARNAKQRIVYSDAEVISICDDYLKSGMTKQAFCKSAQLRVGTISTWLRDGGRYDKARGSAHGNG